MSSIDLFIGFGANLLAAILIVRFIYFPIRQDKSYVFTFLASNMIVYLVLSFLTTVELGLGVGFGLFAIFTVLRYRTITMPTREMTYLFILIALAVLNSLVMQQNRWDLLLSICGSVIVVLLVLERGWGFNYEGSHLIRYERVELLKPAHHEELMDDLRLRTGLPVKRIEVGRINFVNDSAEIKIYFDQPNAQRRTIEYDMGQPDD